METEGSGTWIGVIEATVNISGSRAQSGHASVLIQRSDPV